LKTRKNIATTASSVATILILQQAAGSR